MRIIQDGTTFDIFDDGITTYDSLPAQNYVVRFDQRKGYYLEKYADITIREKKIYGVHLHKIAKIITSFDKMDRSLGVILSGDKGIGKSLCAKILSAEVVRRGMPVIIVDTFYPGIASFLEKIEQEVLVLFDEFDKTFGTVKAQEGAADAQAGLLSLFDGISQGKKLYVITCNSLRSLNDFLVNRPGRFHYHLRFEYPNAEEITQYLRDNISEQYYGEIDEVVQFAHKVDLNYDCLRAIAFELNNGLNFADAIKDLNIININNEYYTVILNFADGQRWSTTANLDLFNYNDTQIVRISDKNNNIDFYVEFDPVKCHFERETGGYFIPASECRITLNELYLDDDEKKRAAELVPESVIFIRKREKDIHYMV